jgi:hyperosmotically inducible protein
MRKTYNYMLGFLLVVLSMAGFADFQSHAKGHMDNNINADVYIISQIDNKMKNENLLKAVKIYATSKYGCVSLTGVVDTALQAEKIITLVKSIKEVKEVDITKLQVKNSMILPIDVNIISQIDNKMKNEELLKDITIYARSDHGYVSLIGEVDTSLQAEKVITLVQSIKGVTEVDITGLKVKSSKIPFTDTYITAKIKGALIRDRLLDITHPNTPCGIQVETKNGVVYLFGCVKNQKWVDKAIISVRSVSGIKAINNSIKIHN